MKKYPFERSSYRMTSEQIDKEIKGLSQGLAIVGFCAFVSLVLVASAVAIVVVVKFIGNG